MVSLKSKKKSIKKLNDLKRNRISHNKICLTYVKDMVKVKMYTTNESIHYKELKKSQLNC